MIVESGQLHFSYSGAFIMDMARTAYWFENRRDWALRLLKCIKVPLELTEDQIFYMQSRGLTMEQIWSVMPYQPLTDEQVAAVLNGKAILTDDSKFIRADDTGFQVVLSNRQADFMEIGDFLISKPVVDHYLKQLEQPGEPKEAYQAVLKAAGFVTYGYSPLGRPIARIEKSPRSLGFQSALLKFGQLYLKSTEAVK